MKGKNRLVIGVAAGVLLVAPDPVWVGFIAVCVRIAQAWGWL